MCQKFKSCLQLKKLTCRRFVNNSHSQRGVTLVELMVALVIGLFVSLAVYSVLNASEGRKRTTTSINDIDQAGSFAAYQLDKALRSAGSGFTGGLNSNSESTPPMTAADYTFACRLRVRQNTNTLLPMQSLFGLPFVNVPQNLTLAPLVILDNAATDGAANHGDVLISMGGSGGLSEAITNLSAAPIGAQLEVTSEAGLSARDILLIAAANSRDSAAIPGQVCPLQQVEPGFSPRAKPERVGLAGDFNDNSGALAAFNNKAVILNLGKNPSFNMFAVGRNNTLFRYDLLQPAAGANTDSPNPSEFVDSVFQMEAIYGITNGAAGNFAWQAPIGAFAGPALLAGTAAANNNLQSITMVRVALVMRTNVAEKNAVSPTTLTLFNGTGLEQIINGLDPRFRYRVIETTIPIRNALAALAS